MSDIPALFFSISDLELYKKLESLSQEHFPDQTFAFLGSTFADAREWRPGQKGDLLPTSRLMWRWVFMNERTERDYVPAINCGEFTVVFVHELGREAYHYAVRHRFCPQTLRFHKSLVGQRLVAQGGKPPDAYIATRPTDARLIQADGEYFSDPNQRIHYLETDSLDDQFDETIAFLKAEVSACTRRARIAVA